MLDGAYVIYLQVLESPQRVKTVASVGQRLPIYCTAVKASDVEGEYRIPPRLSNLLLAPKFSGFKNVSTGMNITEVGSQIPDHVHEESEEAWLDQRQVTLVLLDASPAGQPLYERQGFIACQEVEIFERQAPQPVISCPPNIRALSEPNLGRISALDAAAFGADRRRVLRLLQELYPERAFRAEDPEGRVQRYLFAQQPRIGPWVMQEQCMVNNF